VISRRSDPVAVVTNLTWDAVKRLRDKVKVKLVLKGILTPEDAKQAAESGIDGIVVSNHGGRVEDGVGATITVLPEIVEAVGGRVPLAGKITKGYGFGLLGNIVVGIIGAMLAGWLLPLIGLHIGGGIMAAIINAVIGAVVLLLVIGFFRK
jgi:uncharacterized membrane protein YeaQ/YmgE (transglycosylase-associated protein family)